MIMCFPEALISSQCFTEPQSLPPISFGKGKTERNMKVVRLDAITCFMLNLCLASVKSIQLRMDGVKL